MLHLTVRLFVVPCYFYGIVFPAAVIHIANNWILQQEFKIQKSLVFRAEHTNDIGLWSQGNHDTSIDRQDSTQLWQYYSVKIK